MRHIVGRGRAAKRVNGRALQYNEGDGASLKSLAVRRPNMSAEAASASD